MTAAPSAEIVTAVQRLQAERDELRDLLRRIDAHVGQSLPADLLAEVRRLV